MWRNIIVDWSDGKLETPYLKELLNNARHITRLYLTGGEPTINKNHWNLLDILIESGHAKHILLEYNSNGVYLKREMFDKWAEFKTVSIGFSIDGMEDVYEKIRYPSKWETIKKNLDFFEQYSYDNTRGVFGMTVLTLNVLNVLDFFQWYYKKGFKKIQIEPHFNVLSRPMELDIRRMDKEQKHKIEDKYKKFLEWVDENCDEPKFIVDIIKNNFQGIINIMNTNPL